MAEAHGRFYPEQGNRQPPRGMERRGGTRLNVTGVPPVLGFRPGGVIAPERPAPAPIPTLPRPDRVQPLPEQAPQKPKKRHTIRNIALAGTALGALGVGVGVYEAYENIPAVHQAVDSAFLDHLKGFFKGSTIEDRFPIKLEQSSFTRITKEEEQKLWQNTKTVDLENHTFTIGFPVDQATINKSPNLRMNQELGTYTFTPAEIKKLQAEGFKTDTQLSGLSKDAQIYYNYDSTKFDASIIAIGIAGIKQGEGTSSFTPAYTNLLIILRDKQTGKNYGGIIDALYAKPLVAPAPYPEKYSPIYENGTPIKPNEPILQLTTDLQDWDGKTGQVLPGQKGQVVLGGISDMGPGVDPNRANFLTPSFLTNPNTNTIATK